MTAMAYHLSMEGPVVAWACDVRVADLPVVLSYLRGLTLTQNLTYPEPVALCYHSSRPRSLCRM